MKLRSSRAVIDRAVLPITKSLTLLARYLQCENWFNFEMHPLESRQYLTTYTLGDSNASSAQIWNLRVNPNDPSIIQVFDHAQPAASDTPVYSSDRHSLTALTFNGGSGNDTLIVDFKYGTPLDGTITYNASTGTDSLQLLGRSNLLASYQPSTSTNLAGIITTSMQTLSFTSVDSASGVKASGFGTISLPLSSTFNSATLQVQSGTGATLLSLPHTPALGAPLTFSSTTYLDIGALSGSSITSITVSSLTDNALGALRARMASGNITVSGGSVPLQVDSGTPSLDLSTAGAVVTMVANASLNTLHLANGTRLNMSDKSKSLSASTLNLNTGGILDVNQATVTATTMNDAVPGGGVISSSTGYVGYSGSCLPSRSCYAGCHPSATLKSVQQMDFNLDGVVNDLDVSIVVNYASTKGINIYAHSGSIPYAGYWFQGDLDNDGMVEDSELTLITSTSFPTSSSTPAFSTGTVTRSLTQQSIANLYKLSIDYAQASGGPTFSDWMVFWGDGTFERVTPTAVINSHQMAFPLHVYMKSGSSTASIYGLINGGEWLSMGNASTVTSVPTIPSVLVDGPPQIDLRPPVTSGGDFTMGPYYLNLDKAGQTGDWLVDWGDSAAPWQTVTAQVATTDPLSSNTYENGSSGTGATLTASSAGALTVDGVTLVAGDKVLIKNESDSSHNGLYVVTTAGASVAYVLTRESSQDQGRELPGVVISVGTGGAINANTAWRATPSGSVNVGTSSIKLSIAARVATVAALPTNTYSNGSSGDGATLTATATGVLTVDGAALAAGDRVLVKNEGTASHNGLYKVTTAGATGVAYVLTRDTEMNSGTEFAAAVVPVLAGTISANTEWIATPDGTVDVGATAVPFQIAPHNYPAGTSLDQVVVRFKNISGTFLMPPWWVSPTLATLSATGASTDNKIDLIYGSLPGVELELEQLAIGDSTHAGDLNYHSVYGFVPESGSGTHTYTVSGLDSSAQYNFRLKATLSGVSQYYYAFGNTTPAAPALSAPTNVWPVPPNSSGQTAVHFNWVSNNTENFTLAVKQFSSSAPLPLFNVSPPLQQSPSVTYSSGNEYTVTLSTALAAFQDQLAIQVQRGDDKSPWVPLKLLGTAATSPAQLLTLSASPGSSGAVVFNLGSSGNYTIYGITANNQLVSLGTTSSSSSVTVSASSTLSSARKAIAFDGSSRYSNIVWLPGVTQTAPIAPSDLTATPVVDYFGAPQARLSWSNLSNSETSIIVQRKNMSISLGDWAQIASLGPDETSYVDYAVLASDVYEYRILASDAGALSSPSNSALAFFAPLVSGIGINPGLAIQKMPLGTNPASALQGMPVTFTATATPMRQAGHTLTYTWTLKDGSNNTITLPSGGVTSTPNLTYTPTASGNNWTISLSVADAFTVSGAAQTLTTTVPARTFNVLSATPLQILGPTSVSEGQTAVFTASGATGTVTWTATNGGTTYASGSGTQFSFTPTIAQTYTIQATSTIGGTTYNPTVTLTAARQSRTVTVSGPALGFTGKSLTFAGHVDQGPGSSKALTYQWLLLNSDGSIRLAPSSAPVGTIGIGTNAIPFTNVQKLTARLATAAALPANTCGSTPCGGVNETLTGTSSGALTVDGVAVVAGDRILVKNETAASHNGLYVATNAGDAGSAYVLTRYSGQDEDAEFNRFFISISSGSSNANRGWVANTSGAIQVGTTNITYSQIKLETARAATAAALPANTCGSNPCGGVNETLTGTANGALTVDGVSLSPGDAVLVKNEADGSKNGLYVATTVGSAGTAYVLTRSSLVDQPSEIAGAFISVGSSGTINANTNWLTSPSVISSFVVPGSLPAGSYSVQLTVQAPDGPAITQNTTLSLLPAPASDKFDWGVAPFATKGPVVRAVVQQSDGKLVVAGGGGGENPEGMVSPFIARFNRDLTLDTSFGPSHTGVVVADMHSTATLSEWSDIYAITINPLNNDLVVVGDARMDNGMPMLAVGAYLSGDTITAQGAILPAGTFDPAFNSGAPRNWASTDTVSGGFAVKALSDGSILIGAIELWQPLNTSTVKDDFLLLKLTSQGQDDSSFNVYTGHTGVGQVAGFSAGSGHVPFSDQETAITEWGAFSISSLADRVQGIELIGSTKVLLSGTYNAGFGLVQYNLSDGTRDTSSFGSATGRVLTPGSTIAGSGGTAVLGALRQLGNGNLLAVGVGTQSSINPNPANCDIGCIVLAEYGSTGTLSSVKTSTVLDERTGEHGDGHQNQFPHEDMSFVFNAADGTVVASGLIGFSSNPSRVWRYIQLNASGASNDGEIYTGAHKLGTDGWVDVPLPAERTPEDFSPTGRSAAMAITADGIVSLGNLRYLDITGNDATPHDCTPSSFCSPAVVLPSCHSNMPLLFRYRTATPATEASALTAAAQLSGSIAMIWTNSGIGQDGFEIRRAATENGLDSSSAMIGLVGANQRDFVDVSATPNTTYYYGIYPYYTDGSGQRVVGTDSNAVKVQTFPTLTTTALLETLSISSTCATVTSSTVLSTGQTYLLVASGKIHLKGSFVSGQDSGVVADAGYWYSATDPKAFGSTIAGNSVGIGFNALGGNHIIPSWGLADATRHTYTYPVTLGSSSALTFQLHDYATCSDNSVQSNDQALTVQIYSTSTTNTTSSLVRRIVAPATARWGTPPVISGSTPISIISANNDSGTAAPWALFLVPEAGTRVLLASGSHSVGRLPNVAAQVATLDPALYPDGEYTLQLFTSPSDSQSSVLDSRPIVIQSAVKSGAFVVPTTDAVLDTAVGPFNISRVYNSTRVNQFDNLGAGWSFSFLDSQLHTTGQVDTYRIGQDTELYQSTPVLHPGDLVYITVPNDGQHVFAFDPIPVYQTMLYAGSQTSVEYLPHFVAVDGSGATLSIPPNGTSFQDDDEDGHRMLYRPIDDEFYLLNTLISARVDHEWFSMSDYLADDFGFNPARGAYGQLYQLTTKDGTSYMIDALSGQIQATMNANGTSIVYKTESDGTINAVTKRGDSNPITLFTIQIDANSRVTQINVPGQKPIHYRYESRFDSNGNLLAVNLISVKNQVGDTTRYAYQDPNFVSALTAVTNGHGETLLQAQYDATTARLAAIINASGQTIPIATGGLGDNQAVQTAIDAAGNVSQIIFDEKFGVPLRTIKTVTDGSGNILDYVVSMNRYSYVSHDAGSVTSFFTSGVPILQSIEQYASVEVAGADANGLRYSYQPDGNTWTRKMIFSTLADSSDDGRGQLISTLERTTVDGKLATTTLGNYVTFSNSTQACADSSWCFSFHLESSKPQIITKKVQIPNGIGYDDRVQSVTYEDYDDWGNAEYSIVSDVLVDADPDHYLGSGSYTTYTSHEDDSYPGGMPLDTGTATAWIELDNTLSHQTSVGLKQRNVYYSIGEITIPQYQVGIPGASYGQVKYSLDAAGEQTYYAYDASGRKLHEYAYKKWTDPDGNTVYGWVGTTNAYDNRGRLTNSYQGSYCADSSSCSNQGELNGSSDHVLNLKLDDHGIVVVDETPYPYTPTVRTVHNDYDAAGRVISTIDQFGGVTSHTYDNAGNKIRTVNPDGTETRSVYDALGRGIWKTDVFKPVNSNLSSSANIAVLTHTVYNQLGQVTATERYKDGWIKIAANRTGSISVPQSELGGSGTLLGGTSQWFNPAGQMIETKDPAGNRIGNIYYPNGNVQYTGILDSSLANGGHVSTSGSGLTTREIWLSDFPSTTGYTTYEYGLYDSGLQMLYDRVTDASGHHTDTYKDPHGRVVRTAYHDGSFTDTLYSIGDDAVYKDLEGDEVVTPEGWGPTSPGWQHVVKIAQRTGSDPPESRVITHMLYDAAGNLIDVWQPTVLDADPDSPTYGEMVQPHTSYLYDRAGNEITEIDAKQQAAFFAWLHDPPEHTPESFTGDRTHFLYDQSGNQIKRTLPGDQSESSTRDEFGRLTVYKDFKGQTAVYLYETDPRYGGRETMEYRFETGATVFTNGVLQTANAEEKTVYGYDTLGRQNSVTEYAGGNFTTPSRTETVTYDPITQQVISRATPEGIIRHEYDPVTGQLRVTWTGTATSPTTGSITTQTAYGYDTQGRLEHVYAFKIGGTSQGTYTGWNSTTQEPTYTGTPLITTYTYDKAGNLDTLTQPNGVFTDYTYDELNRLTDLLVKPSSSSSNKLFEQAFTLQNNGQRASVIEKRYDGTSNTPFSKVRITWKYDDMDRLVEETRDADTTPGNGSDDFGVRDSGDYSDLFGYDLVSNRRKRVSGWDANINGSFADSGDSIDSTTLYTYNSNDQLTAEGTDADSDGILDSGEITTTYTYDANGSQQTMTQGSSTTKYLWDLRNHMVGLDANNDGDALDNGDTEYGYDSNGVRVNQLTHGATNSAIVYLNDDANPTGYSKTLERKTGTSTSNATLNTTYVLGLRMEGQKDATGTVWFNRDGHGSNRGLIESTGTVSATYDYKAFGDALGFIADAARTVELSGGDGVYDPTSRWTYHLARWRNDFRFTSMDTYAGNQSDPISLHKYLYANGDAISSSDPTGFLSVGDAWADHEEITLMDEIQGVIRSWDWSGTDAFELATMHEQSKVLQMAGVDAYIHNGFGQAMAASQFAMAMAQFLGDYVYLNPLDLAWGWIGSRACFVAGTQVLVDITEDGSYITRNIEDLRPGDLVLARNDRDENDDLDLRPIIQVFSKTSDHLRALEMRDRNGNVEIIRTTDDHPFWVDEVGWVRAADLWLGAQVDQSDGSNARLLSSVRETHPEGITVYNFEVEQDHTYFVEDGAGEKSFIWVHNTCVYRAYNRVKKVWTYVGISGNALRRIAEHARKGRIVEVIKGLEDIPYRVARLIEDRLIKKYGRQIVDGAKGTLENINRGIDPKKLPGYRQFEQMADDLMRDLGL
jgi:YD repeat-containing protein